MIPVPVLTPKLSSYWVNLISPVPARIARPLIEGLRNEVVVRDPAPARIFGVTAATYDEALALAIRRSGDGELESTWFDAQSLRNREPLPAVEITRGDDHRPTDAHGPSLPG